MAGGVGPAVDGRMTYETEPSIPQGAAGPAAGRPGPLFSTTMFDEPRQPPDAGTDTATAAVARSVRSAWENVGPPSEPLVDCPCPECEELEGSLLGRSWRDVDAELAEQHEQDLPLLNGAAYRALLAAFLLAALDPECEVGEFLGYSLEPSDFNTPRFAGLTPAQGRAVLAFLRLDLEECEASNQIYADGPRQAIAAFWERFDPV